MVWPCGDASRSRRSCRPGDERGPRGGHIPEKHVGKTDEQLLQRHRDEAKGSGKLQLMSTSSFPDVESTQKYTQYCIRRNTLRSRTGWRMRRPAPPSRSFPVLSVPLEGPLQ
ncbi:RNase A-like domain-containing protein [Streptomyces sp. NPDC090131]|uniref:RNase A-like domain-containing protein n=1 Tax=Streptomyces sp. NPDC090131 TaxID=3365954 RepID=UPI00382FAB65